LYDAAFFEVAGGSDLDVLDSGVGWEVFPACVEGVFDLSGVVGLWGLNAGCEEDRGDESLHGDGSVGSGGVRAMLWPAVLRRLKVVSRLRPVFEFFVKSFYWICRLLINRESHGSGESRMFVVFGGEVIRRGDERSGLNAGNRRQRSNGILIFRE
jgi:hypothetical protein